MPDQLTEHILEEHTQRLNNHGERLDTIENKQTSVDMQMSSVCKELRLYAKATFWFIGTVVISMLGMLTFCMQYILTH